MTAAHTFNGHHKAEGRDVVWLTPPHILDALGRFDLDPCAAPDPKPWPTAERHYTLPTDGLIEPWFGRVWVNPPYGNAAWEWLHKLADHGRGTALVFARTDVRGFHESVWQRADAVLFLRGRLSFHHRDGSKARANGGAPSCLVAYGPDDVEVLSSCGLDGAFVDLSSEGKRTA